MAGQARRPVLDSNAVAKFRGERSFGRLFADLKLGDLFGPRQDLAAVPNLVSSDFALIYTFGCERTNPCDSDGFLLAAPNTLRGKRGVRIAAAGCARSVVEKAAGPDIFERDGSKASKVPNQAVRSTADNQMRGVHGHCCFSMFASLSDSSNSKEIAMLLLSSASHCRL